MKENQDVQNFIKLHQRIFNFIDKRFSKKSFFGRPLTLLSLALFYVLLHFGGVVENIVNSDFIVSSDIRQANLLAIFRDTELINFFIWITLLGKWQIILIFSLAFLSILWIWEKQHYIMPFLICIFGSELFTSIGKIVFHRQRPTLAVYSENSFSFPSGHATIAVAFYGFVAYFLIRNFKRWKYKINIFFFFLLVIILIGFSRLYLGVHYVSDVWGGYLLGSMWLIISISLLEYNLSTNKNLHKIVFDKTKVKTFISIISFALLAYIAYGIYYQIPVEMSLREPSSAQVNIINDIFSNERIRFTETISGKPQEPVSFIIIAKNDEQFLELFQRAEWFLADDVSFSSLVKTARAAIMKKSYPEAPMTPSFWNDEVHVFGFEKETELASARTRHHARFWKSNFITDSGQAIYLGTASFDSGIKWGITHRIAPDIDTERDFLFSDLSTTGMIEKAEETQFVKPVLGNNFSGDPFFTDGKNYVITIK